MNRRFDFGGDKLDALLEISSIKLLLPLVLLFFLLEKGNSQLKYLGNNYLEYSVDKKTDERYFEDWTEFSLSYQNWRLGIQYENGRHTV